MTAFSPNTPGWREQGIIPVLTIDDPDITVDLVETLKEAGLPIVEITLRTAGALEAIRRAKQVKGATIGVGSIRTPDDLSNAVAAGADFLVSPGQTDRLLAAGLAAAVPYFPGAVTASEMMRAFDAGYTCLKFFPAEAVGGAKALSALAAPLAGLHVMPTGGITLANLSGYRALASVIACGGSWMVPAAALAARDFATIGAAARAARDAAS
ncbi:MAG: bifunctional 4-hydroxy-2-oxoglutarate aldolase/2-dehydro-3-deoxy-phosphogluconate aldolase [Proteobacteria bacterium]|nr:bifunctional 4-hydroxy-2-oxoglutarate aldolase/2-dehydro-3-deoxy-phosphogluconate aldolase [Pseudomonadota bacterium]